ncbi:MAG: trigger factor [Desulfobacterales bacterium]
MHVTVEDVSDVKKTLHIEIPHEEVALQLDTAYSQLKKTAKIKGFRPGKAPRSVLERMFKKDVHADVSSNLIKESFLDALKETALKVIGNPELDPPELKVDQAYKYAATVEVKPDIKDIDFKGLSLKKNRYKVSDTEIELQIKALQKKLTRHKPIAEERPAREGDFVMVTYEGLKDGKPYSETQRTENFTLKIGDGRISPAFDEGLVGMKADETREIKVTFPEDHSNAKLAGATIDFQVTLTQIREEDVPTLDDELAKRAGNYATLADLEAEIRRNLEEGYSKRAEQEINEQIFADLIGKVDFDVPQVMIDFELDGIVDDAERSFAYRNKSLEEAGLTRETIAQNYRDTAIKQVKRHLILEKIIDQESLTLGDEEVDGGMQEMADAFQQPVAQIKSYYSQNADKLDYFKQALLEKKAIKLILESSVVEEVEPSEQGFEQTEADGPGDVA